MYTNGISLRVPTALAHILLVLFASNSLSATPLSAVTTIPNRFCGKPFVQRDCAASVSADTIYDLQYQGYNSGLSATTDSSIFILKSWSATTGRLLSSMKTVGYRGLPGTTDLNKIVSVGSESVFLNVRDLTVLRLHSLSTTGGFTDLKLPYPIYGPIGCLFSKNNSLVLISASGKLMLIDLRARRVVSQSYLNSLLDAGCALQFSKDESKVFLFKDDKSTVQRRTFVFNLQTNSMTDSLDSEYRSAFDVSTNSLVNLSNDTTVVVQSLVTKSQSVIRTEKTVKSFKLNSIGNVISVLHKDSTISCWDLLSAQKIASSNIKGGEAVWNESGTELLTYGQSGLVLYNTMRCSEIAYVASVGIPQGFRFASDSIVWYSNNVGRIIFLNIFTKNTLCNINVYSTWRLTSNSRFVLLDSTRIYRLPLNQGEAVTKVPSDDGLLAQVKTFSLRSDGKRLVSISDMLKMHDCETGKLICQRRAADIDNVIWGPDSTRLFAHRLDATTLVLSGRTLDSVGCIRSPIDPRLLTFSHDGTLFLTAQADSTITIRRMSDLSIIKTIKSNCKVVSAAISYDNRTIAFLGQDDRISIWDTSKISASATPPPAFTSNFIYRFSPAGNFVVTETGILSMSTKRTIALPAEVIPNVSWRYCGIYDHDSLMWVSTRSGIAKLEIKKLQNTTIAGSYLAICHPDFPYAARSLDSTTSAIFSFNTLNDTVATGDFQKVSGHEWSTNGRAIAGGDEDYSLKVWLNDVVRAADTLTSDVSSSDMSSSLVFRISPNPAQEFTRIQFHEDVNVEIYVRTIVGNLVYACVSNGASVDIDTSTLPTGTYVLDVRKNGRDCKSQLLFVTH